MNPTNLIRCVVATLAASALLSAQSAPAASAGPQAPRARSDGKATDRMQVRLAEVIAMLEEDDLSPEQRAQAKRKLQEIVAKLRETPAPSALSAPGLAPGLAPAGGVPSTPRPPRAARTPTTEVVTVEPQEPARAAQGRIIEKREGREGEPPTVVYRSEGGDYKVARPVEGLKAGVYHVDGDKVVRVDSNKGVWESVGGDVERLQAEAKKLRAEAEAMRAKIRSFAERDNEKAEANESTEARKLAVGRYLLEQSRAGSADAAKVAEVRARDRAAENEPRVLRAYELAKPQNDEVRGRVATPRAARTSTGEATTTEAPTRARRREPATDGDDDVRKLMDDMRKEMREIRELLQQMRKQAQSSQAPRNPNGGFDSFGPAGGNAVGMGGGARNRAGAQSVFGQQGTGPAWRGAFGGTAGKNDDASGDSGGGQNTGPLFRSSNKAPEGGASPFWGFRGQGTANGQGGNLSR